MASERTMNYTEAETAELVEAYKADPTEATIKAFAEKFGKSTRSIVAKLAHAKVYESKTKAKSEAAKAATKEALRKAIERRLDIETGALESLEKGTKGALEALASALSIEY